MAMAGLENVGSANERVAYALAYIVIGFVLKKLNLLQRADGESLLRLIFNLTIPCVLLRTFSTLTFSGSTFVILGVATLHSVCLAAAGIVAFRKRSQPQDRALLAGGCVGVNLGLFVYPFAEAIWGAEGLVAAVIFDMANQWSLLLVSYVVFLKYAPVTADAAEKPSLLKRTLQRAATNPCLLALYASIALQVFQMPMPSIVNTLTEPIATANKPIALLALGILVEPYVELKQLRNLFELFAVKYAVSLLLGAAVMIGASAYVPASQLAPVIVCLTAPVPMLTVSYAVEFACNSGLAAVACNLSNLISFCILLAVANLSLSAPQTMVPAMLSASGVLLAGLLLSRKMQPAKEGTEIATASAKRPATETTKQTRRSQAMPAQKYLHVGATWGSLLAPESRALFGERRVRTPFLRLPRSSSASHPRLASRRVYPTTRGSGTGHQCLASAMAGKPVLAL